MAFRFGLEAVLKHRKRTEDSAQREFMEAQAAVDECLKKIEAMYKRIDEVREEIHAAEKRGTPESLDQAREMAVFIDGHKIRIERERLEARRLLVIAEEKQEALIEAAKEKRVLVKLKERRLNEYKEWLKQMEAKELDDQTMTRLAWGRK